MAVTTFTKNNTPKPAYEIYRYNLTGRSARINQYIAAVRNPQCSKPAAVSRQDATLQEQLYKLVNLGLFQR